MHQKSNVLVNVLKVNRKSAESKEMEIELKSNYALCGKLKRTSVDVDVNKSNSDDSYDDNLEVFGGFEDGLNESNISNMKEV